jgi:hypothetical protein
MIRARAIAAVLVLFVATASAQRPAPLEPTRSERRHTCRIRHRQ